MFIKFHNLIPLIEMDHNLSHPDSNSNSDDTCNEITIKCNQIGFIQNDSDSYIEASSGSNINKNNENYISSDNHLTQNSLEIQTEKHFIETGSNSLNITHNAENLTKSTQEKDNTICLQSVNPSLSYVDDKNVANHNLDAEDSFSYVANLETISENSQSVENYLLNTRNTENSSKDYHCNTILTIDDVVDNNDTRAIDDSPINEATLVQEQISVIPLQIAQTRIEDHPDNTLEVQNIEASPILSKHGNNSSLLDASRLECLSKVVNKSSCDTLYNSPILSTVSSESTEGNVSCTNNAETTKFINHSEYSSMSNDHISNSLETQTMINSLTHQQSSNSTLIHVQNSRSDPTSAKNVSELVEHENLISSKQNFSSSESTESGNNSQTLSQSQKNSTDTLTSELIGKELAGDISFNEQYFHKAHHINDQESEDYKLFSIMEQYISHIKALKNENENLKKEISHLNSTLISQETAHKKVESRIQAQLTSKLEKLSKDCNVLQKEKEAIVIRYANSEKEVIMEKKVQQDLEKKLKEANKERDALLLKLKNIAAENNKHSVSLENKTVEIIKLQKQVDKLNGDCNSRDVKIKWLQNKLKIETTSHQETQMRLDHTQQRLNEMREEAEQVRRDCQEMIKCYQEAEEIKSVKLDSQLKQKLSELEVQKQEKSDQEQIYQLLRQELEALKKKQRMTMEDNNSLTLKIHSLEKDRLEYEQTLSKLKDSQNLSKQEVVDLTARLAEMENLRLQLEREREKSAASLREVERLRLTNAELQADMGACHLKEGELLEFTEKLTEKTVQLQSDHCLQEVKVQALDEEVLQGKKIISEMQQKYQQLVAELESTIKERHDEVQLLARKLAEKTKNVEKLNVRLDETENENRVLKRRHIASIKELSRELYQCKRRLESFETNNCIRADSTSLGSRTSSTASLDVVNSNENGRKYTVSPSSPFTGNKTAPINQSKGSSVDMPVELDKEMLIERIIKLQKMLARKTDKIDFLEDHIEQLIREMRKKSRCVDFKAV